MQLVHPINIVQLLCVCVIIILCLPCIHVAMCICVTIFVGPAQFETCPGDGNISTPQMGCSGIEELSSTVGQSVDFNIALSHQSTVDNCFNQSIQAISLQKNGSEALLVECSDTTCTNFDDQRLKVTRSVDTFSITVTVYNLDKSDIGNYIATADIRRPSNNMRVYIFKNFSLDVVDATGR